MNVSSTSIRLAVTLQKVQLNSGDLLGGHLYCIAMINGSIPTSTGSIKGASSDGSTSKGADTAILAASVYPITLWVNFNSLKAIQAYAIFCYPETSVGTGDTLNIAIGTKVVAATACCKRIGFINSPPVVYGDLTKYVSASRSSYVFSYFLSEAPTGSIQVFPVLYLNGIISTTIQANPPSITFTSSSVLLGQFVLSATSDVNGTFSLSLGISGSSREQFVSVASSVRITSSVIVTPPPVMTSCKFTDSGQSALISFDSPTDFGSISDVTWLCSTLFAFRSASLTTCTWSDSHTVKASFGAATIVASNITYLNLGDTVTLLGGRVKALCTGTAAVCKSNPFARSSVVTTLKPQNPSPPNVILIAPRSLGSTFNLTLDPTASYGNGGRLYASVVWTVSAISYGNPDVILDTAVIQGYLNSVSAVYQVSAPINIVGSSLGTASYTFTLTLTNFLGLSASQTVLVTATGSPDVVQVSIIGPSYKTIVASSPLQLQSIASLSHGASKSSTVGYTWTLQQGTTMVSVSSMSADPSKYVLTPYTLKNDKLYTVTVTATVGTSAATASTSVYVANGIITAVVVGGSRRSTPVEKSLTLDGSSSMDENSPSSLLAYAVSQLSGYCRFSRYRAIDITIPHQCINQLFCFCLKLYSGPVL